MKRLILVPFVIALLAVLVPATALAKGASEAEIVGPGLDAPISLAGENQPGGEALMQIAEAAGFFPAVFAQSPDPMLDARPSGDLGPRYTITYVMPGPNNEVDELVQVFYPYASQGPVSYMEPGQRFWTTERTRGGWFLTTPSLKDLLVQAGLPRNAPLGVRHSELQWKLVGPLTAVIVLAALGGLAALLIRRRPQTA